MAAFLRPRHCGRSAGRAIILLKASNRWFEPTTTYRECAGILNFLPATGGFLPLMLIAN